MEKVIMREFYIDNLHANIYAGDLKRIFGILKKYA